MLADPTHLTAGPAKADRLKAGGFKPGTWALKATLDDGAHRTLTNLIDEIGSGVVTREDEVFLIGGATAHRHRILTAQILPLVAGEDIRDWSIVDPGSAIWPYDPGTLKAAGTQPVHRFLWPWKTQLSSRVAYGQSQLERGLEWFEYSMFFRERFRNKLSIAFAFVATHNHFVLDRGDKVFNRSAPVIKLSANASEEEHLALLGLLNSSTACFWMKQTMSDKGNGGIGGGIGDEMWERRFEHDATKLASVPVPPTLPRLGTRCTKAANAFDEVAPIQVLQRSLASNELGNHLSRSRADHDANLQELVALQEELDWETYRSFGLDGQSDVVSNTLTSLRPGERAFEIVMARKIATGELQTAWFDRHGSTAITEIPAHWPEPYRHVVQRRIELIESNPDIALIEQPEYKRRWNVEPWEEQVERALREWLLDRLESHKYWSDLALTTVARLSDRARLDDQFMRAAAVYRGQDVFDVSVLVAELVAGASVPFLPVLRYKASGLRKRDQWERTWDLQRRADAIDARVGLSEDDPQRLSVDEAAAMKSRDVGEIPVPPKYTSVDFSSSVFWKLRGKLDVPKERFISYPFGERDADPTPVIAWAGWDHLQLAKVLATYSVQMKESEGWSKERLTPLLAGLLELLPWLTQWHNEIDAEYGQRMGEYFEGFIDEEARALGLTREATRAWTPPAAASRRRGRRKQQTDD